MEGLKVERERWTAVTSVHYIKIWYTELGEQTTANMLVNNHNCVGKQLYTG